MNEMHRIINKTMDRGDLATPEAKTIISELNHLILLLRQKNLKISSWYGVFDINNSIFEKINRGYNYEPLTDADDDKNFPWFLYWEIVWLVLNNDFKAGHKLLDIGGSSSLMSYYLAWKGLDVVTIDIQNHLVENANEVAQVMNWSLRNYTMDARDIKLNESFDHIISVCVYEHIPINDRIQINEELKKLLADNGTFSITIDYRNPSKLARISSPKSIKDQFVLPSGLKMVQNAEFHDNQKNYLLHPFYHKSMNIKIKRRCIRNGEFSFWQLPFIKKRNDYTFAALFLKKNNSN